MTGNKRKKKTEITVEFDEVFVIRRERKPTTAWCAECGETVQMLTPDVAAVAGRASSRTIYRWVEAGRLHFTETRDGLLLICSQSLSRHLRLPRTTGPTTYEE